MATSPTVLAGVSSAPVPAPVVAPARFPVVPLLIAVVTGVLIAVLGVGGVVYYLARSGKLPLQSGAAVKGEPAAPVVTHALVLEPMLVNLADSGSNSYLRVAMTLRVADVPEKKGAKPKEEKSKDDKEGNDVVAAVRDTTLTVLGQQTAENLLAPDGKARLKAELKSALAEHNADLKVTDVFFTDFLVQR
jgi:flagellar FliL protein